MMYKLQTVVKKNCQPLQLRYNNIEEKLQELNFKLISRQKDTWVLNFGNNNKILVNITYKYIEIDDIFYRLTNNNLYNLYDAILIRSSVKKTTYKAILNSYKVKNLEV